MTDFPAWLQAQAHRDDALGALARDAAANPPPMRNWTDTDLRSHLREALATQRCIGKLECVRPLATLTAARKAYKRFVAKNDSAQ